MIDDQPPFGRVLGKVEEPTAPVSTRRVAVSRGLLPDLLSMSTSTERLHPVVSAAQSGTIEFATIRPPALGAVMRGPDFGAHAVLIEGHESTRTPP